MSLALTVQKLVWFFGILFCHFSFPSTRSMAHVHEQITSFLVMKNIHNSHSTTRVNILCAWSKCCSLQSGKACSQVYYNVHMNLPYAELKLLSRRKSTVSRVTRRYEPRILMWCKQSYPYFYQIFNANMCFRSLILSSLDMLSIKYVFI